MTTKIRAGELLRPLSATLTDPAVPNESIAGMSVRFLMRFAGDAAYRVDDAATITDAVNRRVLYEWKPGDTDVPGMYTYRWVLIRPDGKRQSFPTREQPLEIVGFETYVDGLPFSTATDSQRYVKAADGAEPIRLQFVLEDAAQMVAVMAPSPDPLPGVYPRMARRAELRVFDFLWTTSGYKKGFSKGVDVLRRGETFGGIVDVEGIVAGTMGDYYVPPNRRGAKLTPVPIVAPLRSFGRRYSNPLNR